MLHQFKNSVKAALASDEETWRKLRARSAKQRFPVAQWVQDLETLQSTAIIVHQKEGSRTHWNKSASPRGRHHSRRPSDDWRITMSRDSGDRGRRSASTTRLEDHSIFSRAESPVKTTSASPENRLSLGIRLGPGHSSGAVYELEGDNDLHSDEYVLETEQVEAARRSQAEAFHSELLSVALDSATTSHPSFLTPRSLLNSPSPSPESSLPNTPRADEPFLPPPIFQITNESNLSVDLVIDGKRDFNLQNVDPTFTDSDEHYLHDFEHRLAGLDTKNSEKLLSGEKYLVESEKEWFKKFRAVKLRRSPATSPAPSLHHWRPSHSRERSLAPSIDSEKESFRSLLGDNYQRPTLLRRVVLYRIGDWPIYSFLLALGQIIAATSYQVTLLSGTIKQDDDRFYTIAAIYLTTSIIGGYYYGRSSRCTFSHYRS
jgi:alpha-1,3-glucan synthase